MKTVRITRSRLYALGTLEAQLGTLEVPLAAPAAPMAQARSVNNVGELELQAVREFAHLGNLVRESAVAKQAERFSIADAVIAALEAAPADQPSTSAASAGAASQAALVNLLAARLASELTANATETFSAVSSPIAPAAAGHGGVSLVGAAPLGATSNVVALGSARATVGRGMGSSSKSSNASTARFAIAGGIAAAFAMAAAISVYVAGVLPSYSAGTSKDPSASIALPSQTGDLQTPTRAGSSASAAATTTSAPSSEQLALVTADVTGGGDPYVGRIEAQNSVSVFYVPGLNKAASSVVVWITDDIPPGAKAQGDL